MILSEVQQRQNSRGHIERGIMPVTDRCGATPDTDILCIIKTIRTHIRAGQHSSFCVGDRYGSRVCEILLQFGSVAIVPERIHQAGSLSL